MTSRSGPPSDALAAVRDAVRSIPPGQVATYGQIGRELGLHARAVGRFVSRLDDADPWWRVVRADGTPAACHGGAAPSILRSEGVGFVGERVDLARCQVPWGH